MAHGTAAFTKDKLKKMEASGRVPINLDRDRDSMEDNYGFTASRGSNSAELKRGGSAKPHMGRPGRANGGKTDFYPSTLKPGRQIYTNPDDTFDQIEDAASRASKAVRDKYGSDFRYDQKRGGRAHRATGGRTGPDRDMNKSSTDVTHLGDLPKLRARGGRAEHEDESEDRALVKKMVKSEARTGENRGGRTHNAEHRHHRAGGGRSESARDAESDQKTSKMSATDKESYANERDGGRAHRARGGRSGKGKTVVNVIVGRGGPPQGAAPIPVPVGGPPPMPPPPAAPPPRPPMPLPMAGAGAPMGPMGAPPGGMPMRARGGKIPGPKDGGNGGLGRLEKAREEGARY